MKNATNIRKAASRGFTLIEVMVATAVMAIMVVMIGSLFQQASSSWDAGYARAEGGMAVRAVVGALTRDLATVVDGRRFDDTLDAPIDVTSSSITMYRLRAGAGGARDIVKVEYSGGSTVKRTEEGRPSSVLYKDSSDNTYGASFSFMAGPEPDGSSGAAATRPYEANYYDENGAKQSSDFPGEVRWTIPYIKVRCQLSRSGSFSGLTVRSLGKDLLPNEDSSSTAQDDIIVR